ncbi:MAG TPA: dTDP-4-dehydrorhamnose 3,5-epimerase family protein [Caulobacteraceae bacterium]|nr:dTDP-4-dehydrorhamnose 3,5-epimerase family protein [Caulobacteraceae bacterium]
MKLEPLELAGAYCLRPEPRGDERGRLTRLFCRETFAELGLADCSRQISEVTNPARHTLRGLHFQRAPHAETKLIWVTRGALYDVLVDLRPNSPTHGRWQALELSAGAGEQIYAPAGLAHGYLTLSDDVAMVYFIDTPYAPDAAMGINYADPDLAIPWPSPPAVISDKDCGWPTMARFEAATLAARAAEVARGRGD